MDVPPVAWWEIGLMIFLALWAGGCACYAFRVPRIHVLLNRHNRFGLFASWALATTADISIRPGAHSLEFCDLNETGKSDSWKRVLASDDWVWHAFLWFPGKIAAFRLQCIGREIAFFSQLQPPATRLISEHGARLECCVRELHPLASHTVRRVRLLQRVIVDGNEVERIVWQSTDANHGISH
jgi:hypothetical protein